MTRDEIGDDPTDKTVENAEELGGGYGGPFPAEPEKEGDAGHGGGSATEGDADIEPDEAQSPT